ncbi:hypothetical protein AALA80_18950 [Oscillospiraceae bacterium 50-60]
MAAMEKKRGIFCMDYWAMFEKNQNAQTADLDPPLCVKCSCRASARLQKFALTGEKSLAVGHSAIFQTRPGRFEVDKPECTGGAAFHLRRFFAAAAPVSCPYSRPIGACNLCSPTNCRPGTARFFLAVRYNKLKSQNLLPSLLTSVGLMW